jgi:hypothetical protein
MKLKLEITDVLIHKFSILIGNQLDRKISKVDIEDLGNQYQFRFEDERGGGWHFELDKNPHDNAWYTLHCSNQKLELPIHYIKDLKVFCQQIGRIKQMQTEYVNNR